jgi:crotonobetainyl-CoA:carnitine CoA-transferase CaiB-like acyl-CoA transferase
MTVDKGESKGPLHGIRVIDLSMMLAGPSGSMLMGDLGAEIIKVEPLEGDETRVSPPYSYAENMSAYYWSINRNKKSVVINLKSPEGRQVLYDLVAKSDVVYDNYRPGVLDRLQINYETLKRYNPQIICCSISTYGYTGLYRDRPGYDLVVQAVSGGMSITGEPGGSPVRAGIPLGDLVGGLLGVHGVLAAYIHRQKTGEGQRLEVSLLDGQVYLLTYIAQYYFHSGKIPGPIGSGHQSLVPYQAFKTKDIQIVIVAHQDHHFRRLCQALGKPEWAEDPRFATRPKRLENKSILIPLMESHLLTRPGDEWLEAIHKAGVPAGPINTLDRVLSDPQVLSRDMVVEADGPGKEHTREILTNLLGYSREKIEYLKQKEAIKLAE